jgi:hypothetical protein
MRTIATPGLAAALLLSGGLAAAETHTVDGTLFRGATEDGVPAYFKLIGEDAQCADPGPGLQAGQTIFQDGKAAYSLPGVADGSYTACFFIDSDDNVQESLGPSSGDFGAIKPLQVEGDMTLDVEETEWMRIP